MDIEGFDRKLEECCGLTKKSTVVAAVSAGPDSVCLLHLLHRSRLALALVCTYVDHGLRPEETVHEIRFLNNFCGSLDIPFEVVVIDPKRYRKRWSTSLEESCRILRYRALKDISKKYRADAIAVGHTADDQAEEVLLRLIRGSGLAGLSGMDWRNDSIIRPLLDIKKDTILSYLNANGICFCIDSTNSDPAFLRNRVRLELLPLLEEKYNSAMRKTLVQTADILTEDDDYLQQAVNSEIQNCVYYSDGQTPGEPRASILNRRFLRLHTALQRRIIEQVCCTLGTPPSYAHIILLCDFAANGENGKEQHLGKGLRVVKKEDGLQFLRAEGRLSSRQAMSQSLSSPILLKSFEPLTVYELKMNLRFITGDFPPDTIFEGDVVLDLEKISLPLILRHYEPGERFRLSASGGRKKISRYLSDKKVPLHLRSRFPVLADSKGVIAILGQRASCEYGADATTRRYLLARWTPFPD